jgi:FMN phosphatase YigB (HAD superfamily)
MQVIQNDHIVCFDVDDTLVMWVWDQYERQQLEESGNLIQIHKGQFSTLVSPHKEHIELLKRYKAKGKFVIVWSQSGYDWASTVVKALGLEEHVDLVLTKPEKYVDDLDANEWMEHVY